MKYILTLILALVSAFAHAGPNDLVINQRNATDNGVIPRIMASPVTDSLLFYNTTTIQPGYLALGSGLSISSGVLNTTPTAAYTFNYGAPVVRNLALATSYLATDSTKAAIVTVSPQCTASLSLVTGTTCSLQARIGTGPLTCSTGSVVATWTNGNTGTLTVGLGLNQTVGAPYGIAVPAGQSFILCAVSGTFTIAASEQSAG